MKSHIIEDLFFGDFIFSRFSYHFCLPPIPMRRNPTDANIKHCLKMFQNDHFYEHKPLKDRVDRGHAFQTLSRKSIRS
jgi:hypothetical protein